MAEKETEEKVRVFKDFSGALPSVPAIIVAAVLEGLFIGVYYIPKTVRDAKEQIKTEQQKLSKDKRFTSVFKTIVDLEIVEPEFLNHFDIKDRHAIENICFETLLRPNELVYVLRTNPLPKIDWKKLLKEDPEKAKAISRIYYLQGKIQNLPENVFNQIKNMDAVPERIKKTKWWKDIQEDFDKYQKIRRDYIRKAGNILKPLLSQRRQQQQELKRRLADRMRKQRDKAKVAKVTRQRKEMRVRMRKPRA